ncbi:MAG: SDR family NAD(P)-dependent oxidoreductase, partial [Acidimicrobiales bacterium]
MSGTDPARVALITGGSKGLGAGLVDAYLAAGYCVETCSRSKTERVEAWESDPKNQGRFTFTSADVSVSAEADGFVKQAAARRGRIDVLVNNAGVAREGVIGLFADAPIDQVVDLNLKGTIYVTRAASRVMLAKRSGSIVNISSIIGLSGYRGLSVYGATKAAMDGFTRAVAR